MKKVKIDLENCYGIKKLSYTFDFEKGKSYLLYASNGMMKTSFTKTFQAISSGKKPSDEVFGRKSKYDIMNENDEAFDPNNIFVINSYENEYISPNSAKLMIDNVLKEKYDKALDDVTVAKSKLLDAIKVFFNDESMNIESEFGIAFEVRSIEFLETLLSINENGTLKDINICIDFKKHKYSDIFNDGIEKFVSDPKNLLQLQEYEERYTQLLNASQIFKRGIFSQYNAEDISVNLSQNGFFGAEHRIILNGIQHEIKTSDELTKIVETERNKIFNDEKLKKKFDKIDKELNKRALVKFRKVIESTPEIITQMTDYKQFRKNIWIQALNTNKDILKDLLNEFGKSKAIIDSLKEQAKKQRTDWDNVLEIFNSRFTVPFIIEVPNQDEVLLKGDIPAFIFKYVDKDNDQKVPIERKDLEKILSQGEKRALYLLNIIYDIESLKKSNHETLIVADDIAESFDYKNKYAIIEYLQESLSETNLNFIILTHNFDFFRTCSVRMCDILTPYMVTRIEYGFDIIPPKYVFKNPFSQMKKGMKENNQIDIITSIPFVRNLIEYTHNDKNPDYLKLTALLHIKQETKNITIKDLEDLFNKILSHDMDSKLDFSKGREIEKVYDLIIKTAKDIVDEGPSTMDLGGKIVLSMAIRLLSESYIINKIVEHDKNDDRILDVQNSGSVQTGKLVQLYKDTFADKRENIVLMNKVLLLSSENIHINSFMFEPIIDMSIKSLVDLFGRVSILNI